MISRPIKVLVEMEVPGRWDPHKVAASMKGWLEANEHFTKVDTTLVAAAELNDPHPPIESVRKRKRRRIARWLLGWAIQRIVGPLPKEVREVIEG